MIPYSSVELDRLVAEAHERARRARAVSTRAHHSARARRLYLETAQLRLERLAARRARHAGR